MGHNYIKKIKIQNFRVIDDIEFFPAQNVNVITGKNGTGKSTILGMIAQGFSFNNGVFQSYSDRYPNIKDLKMTEYRKLKKQSLEEMTELPGDYKDFEKTLTYFDGYFESTSDEHFRLSPLDARGINHVQVLLKNGDSFNIQTTHHQRAGNIPRFVTRRRDNAGNDLSSNYIFPVLYLGLGRVNPLVNSKKNTDLNIFLTSEQKIELFSWYQTILLKSYEHNFSAAETDLKSKKTIAFQPDNRTIEMISSGEDNIGQILMAIYSFKKLKENFPENYSGGILLIDEIDATLYPAAQNILFRILYEQAKIHNIQVFLTTHSLTLLEYIEGRAREDTTIFANRVKIISTKLNAENKLIIEENPAFYILNNEFRVASNSGNIINPIIDIFFEDKEAEYIFRALIKSQKDVNGTSLRERINYKNVSLSCTNYKQLHNSKVDVFFEKSIVCLDGDENFSITNMANFIDLPTTIQGKKRNPEEFIYDVIFDDTKFDYWKNVKEYSREQFMYYPYNEYILQLKAGTYEEMSQASVGMKPRELWKDWFKYQEQFWKKSKCNNPVDFWKKQPDNKNSHKQFLEDFEKAYNFVAKKLKISQLNIDLEKFN